MASSALENLVPGFVFVSLCSGANGLCPAWLLVCVVQARSPPPRLIPDSEARLLIA